MKDVSNEVRALLGKAVDADDAGQALNYSQAALNAANAATALIYANRDASSDNTVRGNAAHQLQEAADELDPT